MDRATGRRRLTAVTAAVGAGAAVVAALVGFTRPAPVHATPGTSDDGSTTDQGLGQPGGQLGDPGQGGRHRGDGQSGGFVPSSGGGGRPDAGSSGS